MALPLFMVISFESCLPGISKTHMNISKMIDRFQQCYLIHFHFAKWALFRIPYIYARGAVMAIVALLLCFSKLAGKGSI